MGNALVMNVHAYQGPGPDQITSDHRTSLQPHQTDPKFGPELSHTNMLSLLGLQASGSLHWQGQLCIEFVSWQTDFALPCTCSQLHDTLTLGLHHSRLIVLKAPQAITTYEKLLNFGVATVSSGSCTGRLLQKEFLVL